MCGADERRPDARGILDAIQLQKRTREIVDRFEDGQLKGCLRDQEAQLGWSGCVTQESAKQPAQLHDKGVAAQLAGVHADVPIGGDLDVPGLEENRGLLRGIPQRQAESIDDGDGLSPIESFGILEQVDQSNGSLCNGRPALLAVEPAFGELPSEALRQGAERG
jgi:hypothetical protein